MSISSVRKRVSLVYRAARDERGITLMELLVAMFLFGVMATLLVSAVTTFTQTFTKDRVATENTSISATGMNELTRVIRSGTTLERTGDDLPPFAVAKNEEMTLYAYIDTNATTPKPVKVQFKVNASSRELVETRWRAKALSAGSSYWDFETSPYSTRTIARKIVVPAAGEASMFTYFSVNSTTLVEQKLTVPTAGLATADLLKIAVVEVRIKVQSDPTKRADPVTIINRVGIPNLGISRLGAL